MMAKLKWLCFFCISIVVFACKKKETTLPIDEMKVIMWDMFTADEWYNQAILKDSLATKKKLNISLYKQVFLQHNVSKTTFYSSYNYYKKHPDKLKVLLDSVEAYGKRIKFSDTLKVKR